MVLPKKRPSIYLAIARQEVCQVVRLGTKCMEGNMHYYPRIRETCTGLADLILQERSEIKSVTVRFSLQQQHSTRERFLFIYSTFKNATSKAID